MTDLRAGIDATNRRFEELFNAGDAAGAAAAVYTRDARILPPGGSLVQGRDAITGFWDGAARQMGVKRVKLSTVDLQPLGEGAYEIGRATLSLANEQSVDVKYVVVWRQENDRWCWHVDTWNTDAQ
jgi:ketosteroid isomerase-like protein